VGERSRVTSAVDGIGIDVEVTGSGRPVVLLHGFPDTGRLWRHQVPVLVDAGFQVIVPDQRGYGSSDQPSDAESYSIPFLVGDLVSVLDHFGIERAHVVGHDWGAAVAWATGSLVADRVDHLAALSVGFPTSFANAGLPQREKSWYMLLYQFAGIAEQWLTADGWKNFREWSQYPASEVDGVIADLERDASLTPGLNWYRANVAPQALVDPPLELPPVAAPTMGVWSTGDPHLLEPQMTGSAEWVAGSWRYERVDGAGHWMQLEAPDEVSALLVDFLPA
jgi:pimeloyl-ACP methyl ester carboxylesterase